MIYTTVWKSDVFLTVTRKTNLEFMSDFPIQDVEVW